MKKISMSFAVLLFGFALLPLRGADPADFVPKQAALVFYFDTARVADAAWLKDLSKTQPDAADAVSSFEAICKKYNVSEKDFFPGALFVAGTDDDIDEVGFYLKTNIPEAVLPKLVAEIVEANKGSVKIENRNVAGHKIYVFSDSAHPEKDAVALTYLAPDVVLLFQLDDDNAKLIAGSKGGNPLLKKINRKLLAALVFDTKMLGDDAKDLDLTFAEMTLNLVGANQSDLALTVDLDCKNKETVQQIGMQVQMMVPMFLGMMFGKDQKLSAALMQGLQIKPADQRLSIEYNASEATLKAAGEYLKNPANLPNFGQSSVGGTQSGAPAAPAGTR